MTVKGVKLMSESFFSITCDVLELWKKNLRGGVPPPTPPPHPSAWIGLSNLFTSASNKAFHKIDLKIQNQLR